MVGACCERAVKAGVRAGMPVCEASALVRSGSVRVELFDETKCSGALRSLAVWAERFSPLVATDEPDGLLLDVSGCERVFKGEANLIKKAIGALSGLGFFVRAAIAPTFGCAWAMARFGEEPAALVLEGGQRRELAPLPVRALRVGEETVAGLHEVGVARVGELMNIPRSVLPARFSGELLLRLDQAMGSAMEVIRPVRADAPVRVARVFDGPTTRWEAIEITVRELLVLLVRELRARESGAGRVVIELGRADLEPVRLAVSMSRAVRDAAHVWSLVRPGLERVNMGFGVERVEIAAADIRRVSHEQGTHWECDEGARQSEIEQETGRLADLLVNRLGRGRVLVARAVESHIPERAFEMASVMEKATVGGAPLASVPGDRPTVLIESPARAEVILLAPDGPIRRLKWRGEEGEVVESVGPERVAPEWWRSGQGRLAARDYFKVQLSGGRWLWVYREVETSRWFVHGEWA